MKLTGKSALITGGGTGIGAAIALSFAAEGARVAIAGRRTKPLEETAQRHQGSPAILTHPCDVADRASVAALFEWAHRELDKIDILVNAAGVNIQRRNMAELAPEEWDRLLAINATGAYNCCRAVLPQMRRRKDGLIVNICSISGVRAGLLGGIAYNASKFAMNAMGTSLAQEFKDEGIRVSNVHPGEVDTPILEHRPQKVTAEHLARILQPEDVAAAVLMIATLPPRAHVAEMVIKPTSAAYC